MAIIKETIEDKIEIVGEFKTLQIRTATVLKEDGVELTRTFHRHTLDCVSSTKDGDTWTHTDTDVSSESTEVQNIAALVWTDEVKAARKTHNENSTL